MLSQIHMTVPLGFWIFFIPRNKCNLPISYASNDFASKILVSLICVILLQAKMRSSTYSHIIKSDSFVDTYIQGSPAACWKPRILRLFSRKKSSTLGVPLGHANSYSTYKPIFPFFNIKTFWLFHVGLLCQLTIEKCCSNIHLM